MQHRILCPYRCEAAFTYQATYMAILPSPGPIACESTHATRTAEPIGFKTEQVKVCWDWGEAMEAKNVLALFCNWSS